MCKHVESEPEEVIDRHCKELLQELVDAANRIAYALEKKKETIIREDFSDLPGE